VQAVAVAGAGHGLQYNKFVLRSVDMPQPCIRCGRFVRLGRNATFYLNKRVLQGQCVDPACPQQIFVLPVNKEACRQDGPKNHLDDAKDKAAAPPNPDIDDAKDEAAVPPYPDIDDAKDEAAVPPYPDIDDAKDEAAVPPYPDIDDAKDEAADLPAHRLLQYQTHIGIDASLTCVSLYMYSQQPERFSLLNFNSWVGSTRSITWSTKVRQEPQSVHQFEYVDENQDIIETVVHYLESLDFTSAVSVCLEKFLDPRKELDSKHRLFVRKLADAIAQVRYIVLMFGEPFKGRQFLVHQTPNHTSRYFEYLRERRPKHELKQQLYRTYKYFFRQNGRINYDYCLQIEADDKREHPLRDVVDAFTMLVYSLAHDTYRPLDPNE
jgi:hypothetical protein